MQAPAPVPFGPGKSSTAGVLNILGGLLYGAAVYCNMAG